MAALPSGTVTFLFTDVEGSTQLLDELGPERFAEVMDEHRCVIRQAVATHGGVEVDTQGDSFCVVFSRAADALAAAAAAREALGIRVRMGVHTGEPLVTPERYVGIDVHRAARIAAAGHGGQILVSQSTRELVPELPLRDLGDHRLKDLTRPERIWQYGEGDFPPLKSLNQVNLPVASSPLVGRMREVSELCALLGRQRLVTIVGPGGSGKTRLALQVAADSSDDYAGGVHFVPLAPLHDEAGMLGAVAGALGSIDITQQRLDSRTLLVLDNIEHLVVHAPAIADLVSRSQALTILVTSRVPLRVAAEVEYPLEPLPPADAVALFVTRARAVGRAVEIDSTTNDICRRLDGLPLALELAAARTRLLEPVALLARLDRRLDTLGENARDAPDRQRTLAAAIGWSYDLLEPEAQRVFRALGVFAGAPTIDGASTVARADLPTLEELVTASLLKAVPGERLLMLETIREFAAAAAAAAGEQGELSARHARYFARAAEALSESDYLRWYEDFDDMVLALSYLADVGDARAQLRLAIVIGAVAYRGGRFAEGRERLERTLRAAPDADDAMRARAIYYLAHIVWRQGDLDLTESLIGEAIPMALEVEDRALVARLRSVLAATALNRGDHQRARELFEDCAEDYHELGDLLRYASVKHDLGLLALDAGRDDDALVLLNESLALAREVKDHMGVANALSDLGCLAVRQGRDADARVLLRESLSLWRAGGREFSDIWAAGDLIALSSVLLDSDIRSAEIVFSSGDEAIARAGAAPERPLRLIREQVAAELLQRGVPRTPPISVAEAIDLAVGLELIATRLSPPQP